MESGPFLGDEKGSDGGTEVRYQVIDQDCDVYSRGVYCVMCIRHVTICDKY